MFSLLLNKQLISYIKLWSSGPSLLLFVEQRRAALPVNSLVRAADAVALTQSDVGLVHWLDVGLRCHDDVVTKLSATRPPAGKGWGGHEFGR